MTKSGPSSTKCVPISTKLGQLFSRFGPKLTEVGPEPNSGQTSGLKPTKSRFKPQVAPCQCRHRRRRRLLLVSRGVVCSDMESRQPDRCHDLAVPSPLPSHNLGLHCGLSTQTSGVCFHTDSATFPSIAQRSGGRQLLLCSNDICTAAVLCSEGFDAWFQVATQQANTLPCLAVGMGVLACCVPSPVFDRLVVEHSTRPGVCRAHVGSGPTTALP